MKILFVSCYVDNAHWMSLTKKTLDKYLIDCSYEFICLNDAPDTKNGDENYLQICDIIDGETNCYEKILNESIKHDFIHIKIPQIIHIKDRPNHSSLRHIENLNWFNTNLDDLYPNYKNFDFICHIDSDAFFTTYISLKQELDGFDMAGPFIYLNSNNYYIHTGLFFINIKTVSNMKEINWTNTQQGADTGSDIVNFIKNNPSYNIKKLGHYDGYSSNNLIVNDHTIKKLRIDELDNDDFKLIDCWFDNKVIHFRAGSCFAVGTYQHRNDDRLLKYNKKLEAFTKLLL
jgi:hypothetical protein